MNRREKIQVEIEKKMISKRTMETYMVASMVALKKEFGFGVSRIQRYLSKLTEEVEIMASGMIGFEDYKSYTEEFTGVKLEEE